MACKSHVVVHSCVCVCVRTNSNLLLMKCGLKRLGRSSLGQQAGVAIQHLLPNQESLSQCSQAVSRIDTDDKQKVRNTLAFACMPAEP